jgi:putative phosphoribosyl transferase
METVQIPAAGVQLTGDLTLPEDSVGTVLFAHGSGSSRRSVRNQQVATALADSGLSTLLFDLLTEGEEAVDAVTRHLRFDIPMLARRLVGVIDWAASQPNIPRRTGLFGASTGAAAALVAAAERDVDAVVSRGGRPDLAGPALDRVRAPTLLIVGSRDEEVLVLNEQAACQLINVRTEVVAGASHLFEEPGTLEEVARLARDWFLRHLAGRQRP